MSESTVTKKRNAAGARRSDFSVVLGQLAQYCDSLQPGDTVPSHSQLARRFDASEFAVLRALDELRRNGTIIRRQGASTVIADRVNGVGGQAEPQDKLVAKETAVVGVVGRFAPEISELLVPYLIGRALEHALAGEKGITLRFFDCFRNEKFSVTFQEGAASLLAAGVDVLCVIAPEPTEVDGIMAAARQARKPVMFVTEAQLPQPAPQVYIDNRYDGYQAGNYLLDDGHRSVTFVMLGRHQWALDRLAGVRDAFRHVGLAEDAVRVFPAESAEGVAWLRTEFKAALQEWVRDELRHGGLKGAVIAANDHVALDIMEAAGEERQFAILGFDDKPEAVRGELTSFRPPLFEMGHEGARLLLHLVRQGDFRGTSLHSRLPSQLVVRNSTSRKSG